MKFSTEKRTRKGKEHVQITLPGICRYLKHYKSPRLASTSLNTLYREFLFCILKNWCGPIQTGGSPRVVLSMLWPVFSRHLLQLLEKEYITAPSLRVHFYLAALVLFDECLAMPPPPTHTINFTKHQNLIRGGSAQPCLRLIMTLTNFLNWHIEL